MKPIDLLSVPGVAAGARSRPDGFVVDMPWGEYQLGEFGLDAGWYEFRTEGDGAVLTLYDRGRFNLVELQARRGAPAYVHLSAGAYDLSLLPGARPGFYPGTSLQLRPMSSLNRTRLLAGRLFQALRDGVSLARIGGLIRLALSKRTYGLRAPGAGAPKEVGVLAAADRARDLTDGRLGDYERRLAAVSKGPVFLIEDKKTGGVPRLEDLGVQIYGRFTLNPDHPHDFVVVLTEGNALTPDALLLFAEHIVRQPQAEIVVADAWVRGGPTARTAWDPLLYGGGLPTPFASARLTEPRATFANREAFARIAVPVASSETAETFPGAPAIPPAPRLPCSIIIPTRDRVDLLSACLDGLFDKTPWPHEVIVVDNGSVEPATFALFDRYADRGLKVLRADVPFNFSILCNLGAAAAAHDYLVFLNNDVVLHRPDWLERMMAFAVLPEAGAVGARLLYGDGRLQHGGVMLGLTQVCGHLWRGLSRVAQDDEPRLRHSSLRAAVTAACLCVRKARFDAVGGFDEVRFPVTLNDIDLCLKLGAQGWFNIYAAQAEAYHLEGESRGQDVDPVKWARRKAELEAFAAVWPDVAALDPWFSPALSRATETAAFR